MQQPFLLCSWPPPGPEGLPRVWGDAGPVAKPRVSFVCWSFPPQQWKSKGRGVAWSGGLLLHCQVSGSPRRFPQVLALGLVTLSKDQCTHWLSSGLNPLFSSETKPWVRFWGWVRCTSRCGPTKSESSNAALQGTHAPFCWSKSIPPAWLAHMGFRMLQSEKKTPRSFCPGQRGNAGAQGKAGELGGNQHGHGPAAPSASAQDPGTGARARVCVSVLNCSVEVCSEPILGPFCR